MPQLEMAEFVREHGFDFRRRYLGKKRIEKYNALGFAKAGEKGVCMTRAAGAVHDHDPLQFETAAVKQVINALLQLRIVERREFVE